MSRSIKITCDHCGKDVTSTDFHVGFRLVLMAEPLPRLTSRTLTPKALATELDGVRERGFARERDEAVLGESSVAAPIFDHSGHAVGAIGVVGDTEALLPRGSARRVTGPVTDAARAISRELGAARWPVR